MQQRIYIMYMRDTIYHITKELIRRLRMLLSFAKTIGLNTRKSGDVQLSPAGNRVLSVMSYARAKC